MQTYRVQAHWDDDAKVWWAQSEDVVGLVAESETLEALMEDLRHVVPQLLLLNKQAAAEESVEIHLSADRTEGVRVAA